MSSRQTAQRRNPCTSLWHARLIRDDSVKLGGVVTTVGCHTPGLARASMPRYDDNDASPASVSEKPEDMNELATTYQNHK